MCLEVFKIQIMADFDIRGNVAIISISNPPVNSLGVKVRQAFFKFVQIAETESKVKAIVICGNGKTFPAGADITEFGKDAVAMWPSLTKVVDLLENCSKPIISAIHGYALGGGLEIALGTHYRVALSTAKFGFPEVNLGLLPGASGTQRFPRLVGLEAAMKWIASGQHYSAQEAADIGVLDKIFPSSNNIVNCAVEFAHNILNKSLQNRKISNLPVRDAAQMEHFLVEYKKILSKKSRGAIAPHVCLQSVCNSVNLPLPEGIKKEEELFRMLMTSGQSKALRHAFFSERLASRWVTPTGASYKNSSPLRIDTTAVIGLGTMGSGIAIALSTLGKPVFILESSDELLTKNVVSIRGIIDRMYKRGEISEEKCKSMQTNLRPCRHYERLKDVDLVVEAVFESMELKRNVLRKLDGVCKPSTILATNTSSLDIDLLAAETTRPDKVAGMHFFAPAHRMRLLENVWGTKTSPQTLATIMDVGRRMDKCAVLVGNCHQFAANRMYGLMIQESDYMLEEGGYPEQIDSVMRDFGFAMGRYEIADLSGIDVHHRVYEERKLSNLISDQTRFCSLSEAMYELGRYGVKTAGKGWYKFANGKFCVDDDVTGVIETHRAKMGVKPRRILPQEILERVIYPMVNEGFKLLEEGIVSQPQDLDMIWIYGFSWPKHTGGPMFYANTVGLPRVLEVIENHWREAGDSEPHWKPSSMLVNLVNQHGNPALNDWMKLSKNLIRSSL